MNIQVVPEPQGQQPAPTPQGFWRAFWLKATLCGGMAAGLLLSHRLWLTDRDYPLTPIWAGLPPIPAPWDGAVFWGLIALLAGAVVTRRPRPWMLGAIGVSVALGAEDQSRWQPWFYQYVLMLGVLTLFPWTRDGTHGKEGPQWRARAALGTCRFLVACVYLWSGVHKANWTFAHSIFPWMTGPLTRWLPHIAWAKTAPAVPLVEFATGLGLLTVRGRPWALAAAVGVHIFILVCLGPEGLKWNSVVWPWNVAMILFALLLYGRDRTPFFGQFLRDCGRLRRSCLPALTLTLFGVMPLFSFFDRWDSYLSLCLYSGDTRHAFLTLSEREARRLPAAVRRFAVSDGGGTVTLDLSDWSDGELNAPPYPEVRVYKSVARSLCTHSLHPAEIQLVVEGKPNVRTGAIQEKTFACTALSGE